MWQADILLLRKQSAEILLTVHLKESPHKTLHAPIHLFADEAGLVYLGKLCFFSVFRFKKLSAGEKLSVNLFKMSLQHKRKGETVFLL